jgi:hypothetical protein
MAFQNTGEQGWKVLQQYYLDDMSLTGLIMPNVVNISPQAIVPNTATITYNYPTDVAPTGGANGDIWYNSVADNLYKKIGGLWTLLVDRVTNDAYEPPIENLTDCPLP